MVEASREHRRHGGLGSFRSSAARNGDDLSQLREGSMMAFPGYGSVWL